MSLKALLFDMDGTLVDSDPIHVAVFIDFLAERGISLTEDEYLRRIHGRINTEIFAEFLPDEDPHEMDLAKEAAYRARVGDTMETMPGALDLIDRARRAGLGLGLVTNGPRANVEAVLRATRLGNAFDCLVSSNDIKRGKPHPDPYLSALNSLGIGADQALVFEDSPSGIRSARTAGIEVIAVASSLPAETLAAEGASLVIQNFNDPALARRLSLLEGARS